MKRRVISFITVLAMCLSLCPTGALAAGWELDASLCAHHRVHTEECGYVPLAPGQDCTHAHDESCFIAETLCLHQHTEDCFPKLGPNSDLRSDEPSLCTHECSEDSGCVTLALECPHVHDGACGYVQKDAGALCTFVCRICPVEDLIGKLPRSVTPDNKAQVEAQLNEILTLYAGLTPGEQEQLDLSLCSDLQTQLDNANTPQLIDGDISGSKPSEGPFLAADRSNDILYPVVVPLLFDTRGFSYTATKTGAFQVQSGGELYLEGGGKITAKNGSGIEVLAGGHLYISDPVLVIEGSTYGLEIASGAKEVQLSGGTYTGKTAAIWTADGDFEALLKHGYGYFDTNGVQISSADVAKAKTVAVKEKLEIRWSSDSLIMDYTGSPVEKKKLPTLNIQSAEDLSEYIEYSYRKDGDTAFTPGLPTNAGKYEIKASLPEQPSYPAAETNPCLRLTIEKIPAVVTAPTAIQPVPVYNGTPQQLVTAGVIQDGAVREGAVIEFKQGTSGTYSTDIPNETNAGDYPVWYRVKDTENYTGVPETEIENVLIQPKPIAPTIEVWEASYVYDGTKKAPKITVKDGNTVIDEDQYEVKWNGDLTSAKKHTATIKSKDKGNYTFTATTAEVEIVAAPQGALSIADPGPVCYGDTITLSTVGGVENGKVTWSFTSTGFKSTIKDTGVLTVKDTDTITVKAVRTVDNYKTVEATRSITIKPKPVTAVVSVENKSYDGTNTATVTSRVSESDLVDSNDPVKITNLTGTFSDANVGTNKTVTLNSSAVHVDGADGKYSVSFPATATADITPKQVAVTVTLSDNDMETDADGQYFYYDGNAKTPAVTVKFTDGSNNSVTIPASNYNVSYSNNKNVGTATVTVTPKEGGNYTFKNGPESVTFEIKNAKAVLTGSPQAKDLTYNGNRQDLVTVGTATGGTVWYSETGVEGPYGPSIPQKKDAGTYTVHYKVKGDANHEDTAPSLVYVTIKQKEVISPVITVSPDSFTYNGTAHTPAVTVEDGETKILNDPAIEYTVAYSNNINAGTATVHIINANGGNYIVNGSKNFEIEKAPATATVAPRDKQAPYNGTEQELVTPGSSEHGTVVYSLEEDGTYTTAIPTGKDVKDVKEGYIVWYKVLGDSNHNDSEPASVPAFIIKNTVKNPVIRVSPESATYNEQKHEPVVTVRDDNGFPIESSEYTVTYSKKDGTSVNEMIEKGEYTLTITSTGSNYTFVSTATAQFEILPAGQEPLTIVGTRERVYYGDTISLGTAGGSGTITWEVSDADVAEIDSSSGLLKIKGIGPVTVTATSTDFNYITKTATWPIYVEKKPVTAVLTAASKPYDGGTSTTVTGIVQSSALVDGDSITITGLTGNFDDPNAGTDKKVTVTIVNPIVKGTNTDKYNITYPATTTATITKASVDTSKITVPTPVSGLSYTGAPRNLVTEGLSPDGTLEYSLDNRTYSPSIPTGTDAGEYDVWYRVKGDRNHNDTEGTQLATQATIAPQDVLSPVVELTPSSAVYDGNVKKPAVTVKTPGGLTIPESEYTVTYDPNEDWKNVGTYKVKVTNKENGNYKITETKEDFTISKAGQSTLSIVNQPGRIQYGDIFTFTLSALGGSSTGTIEWSIDKTGIATIDQNGLVTILKAGGPVKVTAKRSGDSNYDDATAEWTFNVEKKPLAITVTAADKDYDGKTDATLSAAWNSSDLVGTDQITVTVTGKFESADVGTDKTVKVICSVENAENYEIICPTSTTASINKVTAKLKKQPTVIPNLIYDGTDQTLINGGTTENDIGDIEYSLSETGEYSTTIPHAQNAGTYIVWYRVVGNDNYTGIGPKSLPAVTIEKATPTIDPFPTASSIAYGRPLSESTLTGGKGSVSGIFAWEDDEIIPDDGDFCKVTFTPTDTTNYNTVIIDVQVTVTDSTPTTQPTDPDTGEETTGDDTPGGTTPDTNTDNTNTPETDTSSAVEIPMETKTENGTATTALGTDSGEKLVQAANASQSGNVMIQPEISGDVTKAEVSIPAAAVSRLGSETNADLTISTPIADVTIPNAALGSLSSKGGTINIVTEQAGDAVVVSLTADGETVGSVPGGLMVTIPAEDAGPGAVAVLVKEDGTLEIIRKSVLVDGETNSSARSAAVKNTRMSVPLNGSATVRIVDNSKKFSDVPAENWAASAVAFASARELFNGTSETTFSPDQPMSRAMLATVLYNLEGCPAQSLASGFHDVSSDTWYAAGVSWAAARGIANGYGGGQFGPNDNVTREQFAVMLWKYAGSPAAAGQTLNFADANQASGYAIEALRWATANGVLNGFGDGRLDPSGLATRAQAAQILKNFMENA